MEHFGTKFEKIVIFFIINISDIWEFLNFFGWQKFIKPDELIKICKQNSLVLKNIDGISFNPIADKWNISKDKSINYIHFST